MLGKTAVPNYADLAVAVSFALSSAPVRVGERAC